MQFLLRQICLLYKKDNNHSHYPSIYPPFRITFNHYRAQPNIYPHILSINKTGKAVKNKEISTARFLVREISNLRHMKISKCQIDKTTINLITDIQN